MRGDDRDRSSRWPVWGGAVAVVLTASVLVFRHMTPGTPVAPPPAPPMPVVITPAMPQPPDRIAALEAALEAVRQEPGGERLSVATLAAARAMLAGDDAVLEAAASQPEHARTAGEYVSLLVSPDRIAKGSEKLAANADVLRRIEAAYGVDRHVLVAIWGVESNYGERMGERPIIRSLATLATSEPRRQQFWRRELLAALQIVEAGDKSAAQLLGSWAGAMGHTQFMPSTYLAHAVDFDGDGRRDIWSSPADALGSAANYLKASGWRPTRNWGHEVVLPAGFDPAVSDPARPRLTWTQWQAQGVVAAGTVVIAETTLLQLILPAGIQGPAFLVSDNFRAILRYNNAQSYALAVGHLSDRLAGLPAFRAGWPPGDRALSLAERIELQQLLSARAHDTGGIDGMLGTASRAAIRAFQRAAQLPEDGYPSPSLLERLRREAAR